MKDKKSQVGKWICHKCGERYGHPRDGVSTWHEATCDYCGKHTPVTEPRDYSWPELPRKEVCNGTDNTERIFILSRT